MSRFSMKEGISIFIRYSFELGSPSPVWIRKMIYQPPQASPLGRPSIIHFIFEVVVGMEGVDEFFLIGKILIREMSWMTP